MTNTTSIGLNLVSKNVESVKDIRETIINNANKIHDKDTLSSGFVKDMTNAIDSVAKAQQDSANSTKAYELGTEQDLTKVVVNQQISKLAFQITLNVRNKVLSAYKDIMNMPV